MIGLNEEEQYRICQKVFHGNLSRKDLQSLITVAKDRRHVRVCLVVYLTAIWDVKLKSDSKEISVSDFDTAHLLVGQ